MSNREFFPEEERLCARAIETFGGILQEAMLQEECAELIAAVNQCRRGRINLDQLAEEVADVEIMLTQMRLVLGHRAVDRAKSAKLARLAEKLSRTAVRRG